MPAGMNYDMSSLEQMPEFCDVASIYRRFGGFNLDITNLVAGSIVPPLAPLHIDFATRKAYVVKNVKVYENALSNATKIKVYKKSAAYVGMILGDGIKSAAITAIDTTNAAYDELTVTLGVAVTAKQVLMAVASAGGAGASTPALVANALNYAAVKVENGATVTAIGAVMEVEADKLVMPVSEADKVNLGHRFDFI